MKKKILDLLTTLMVSAFWIVVAVVIYSIIGFAILDPNGKYDP
jgi:hypothetical protein